VAGCVEHDNEMRIIFDLLSDCQILKVSGPYN
jgi:hypothetical protein